MKNRKLSKRAIMLVTVIAAGTTLTTNPFEAKAMYSGETHVCVTVQDSPTHKDVSCIGTGTACTGASTC